MATPVPAPSALKETVAATAATVASMVEVSLASTATAPSCVAVPTPLVAMYAVVTAPIRLSASEPPPATPIASTPAPAASDKAAATEIA